MCGNAANGQKLKNKRSECNVTVDVAVYEFIFRAIKVQRIVDSGWVFEWNWSNAPCTQDNEIIADSFNELARINNSFRLYLIKWFCTCTFCIICRIMAENPNNILVLISKFSMQRDYFGIKNQVQQRFMSW